MSGYDLDFTGMAAAFTDTKLMKNERSRSEMLTKYKSEIIALLVGFRVALITGRNELSGDAPEQCDLCEKPLIEAKLYVDGAVNQSGAWANMCISCFMQRGQGVGWGVGQLYSYQGEYWQCIGGGNPEAEGNENS